MLDHTGKTRERYEDALRAIGNSLDAERFTDLTLMETPEGFVIKGYCQTAPDTAGETVPAAYFFTNTNIDALLERACAQREQGPARRGIPA